MSAAAARWLAGLLAGAALAACSDRPGTAPPAAASAPPPPASAAGASPSAATAAPTPNARRTAMSAGLPGASRPPPPEVKPVEWAGVRYQQDLDGSPRQRDQGFGYLQAVDAASGRVLWELKVYAVVTQPGLESDVQEVYFTRMARVPGRDALEIENEDGARFLVDVQNRSVRAAP